MSRPSALEARSPALDTCVEEVADDGPARQKIVDPLRGPVAGPDVRS